MVGLRHGRIIHLIRNTFRLSSRKYWDEIERDVKPIYTAVNATAARSALDELSEKWGWSNPIAGENADAAVRGATFGPKGLPRTPYRMYANRLTAFQPS